MSFASEITGLDVGVRFYLRIQGIPDIYLDGATPIGPAGTVWAEPTSKGFEYVYREHMLDTSQGIQPIATDLTRRAGSTTPGSLTLTLRDTRARYLQTLFARDKAGGVTSQLAAAVPHDVGDLGTIVTVDSTTAWAASGYAYLGRETMAYVKLSATELDCRVASGGARDLFSVGYCDAVFRLNTAKPSGPRLIADYPVAWHNRVVQLFAFVVDQGGRALDDAIDGACSREIWRGVLVGTPMPQDNWCIWRLETKGIDALLHTLVGRDPIKGMLLQVPGGQKANNEGVGGTDKWASVGANHYVHILTEETNLLHLEITEWPNVADATAGVNATTTPYVLTIAAPGTLITEKGLSAQVDTLLLGICGVVGTDYPDLSIVMGLSKDHPGNYFFGATTRAGAVTVHAVRLNWDVYGSIGKLIGYEGVTVWSFSQTSSDFKMYPQNARLAGYLSPVATTIPFVYAQEQGVQGDTPAIPGYAKIGGTEIVSYTGIAAIPDADHLYSLTGCRRGLMGTQPTEHLMILEPDWTAKQDVLELVFGVGFESPTGELTGASIFDAALQLAVSSGTPGHHGTYDTLGDKVSAGISPAHFDLVRWAEIASRFQPWETSINLFLSKPDTLAKVLDEWFSPLGCFVTARPNAAGAYLITIDQALPPLTSDSVDTIDTGDLDARDPARFRSGLEAIINEAEVAYRWDALKEQPRDDRLTVTDHDSADEFGVRNRVEWTLRGYDWADYGVALARATQWAGQLAQRHGRPYDILTLRLGRTGWNLKPGDVLTVTVPGVPGPDGATGITARAAVVVGVEHTYWAPDGQVGSEVTVALERYLRQSSYSAAAQVSASAGTAMTVAEHAYTPADGSAVDSDYFVNGQTVIIYNLGAFGTANTRIITNRVGNDWTLSSALTIAVGANTRMIPTVYSSAGTVAKTRAFTASNAVPPVLSAADTTAFRYV